MVQAGGNRGASAEKLTDGRRLFAMRCTSCHTLPTIAEYPAQKWPEIIAKMAARAELQTGDREAVLAYILAARRSM
jgi:mono/diheme cytochrome c family protein